MDVWVCCCISTKDSSHRIGSTEEAVLTLHMLAHPCDAVLFTYVRMYAKGAILREKIRISTSIAPSSRLLIVAYLMEL